MGKIKSKLPTLIIILTQEDNGDFVLSHSCCGSDNYDDRYSTVDEALKKIERLGKTYKNYAKEKKCQ